MINKLVINKRFILIWAAIIHLSVFAGNSNSDEIKIPPVKGLYITEGDLSIKDNKIVLKVDKNAYLIIKVPHLWQLKIKYSTNSAFLFHYTTVTEPIYTIKPHMLFSQKIRKGDGEILINLKDTINWEYDSYPYIIIEGTGTLVFDEVHAFVVSNKSSIEKEKNRAFFWRPEQVRSMSMNFLTPVYWKYTSSTFWPDVLAVLFLIVAVPVALVSFIKGKGIRKTFITLSIVTVIIFNMHFLVRFIPIVNVGFYLPNQEKIRKYYYREDFGNLIAKTRETVVASDKVAFMGSETDWFSKEALCFNIAPTPCVYYQPGNKKLAGLMDAYWVKSSDINVIVSYNSQYELPAEFEKTIIQNKNSFIAKKR